MLMIKHPAVKETTIRFAIMGDDKRCFHIISWKKYNYRICIPGTNVNAIFEITATGRPGILSSRIAHSKK